MIDLDKLFCLFLLFYEFWLQVNHLKAILLFDNLTLASYFFSWCKFDVFLKTELFISFNKSFSELLFAYFLSSVFISMYGFNYIFWLNSITLCTVFSVNPLFDACFIVLIRTAYSSLLYKLYKLYKFWTLFSFHIFWQEC